MLVPLQQVVGSGYNAGLTATTFAIAQPDQFVGAGYTSPSGRPIGGLKIGFDTVYNMVATDQGNRYRIGRAALAAASEPPPGGTGYVPKDRRASYLTEAEQASRGSLSGDPGGDPLGSGEYAYSCTHSSESTYWVLLAIMSLIMVAPALKPRYRRGIAA